MDDVVERRGMRAGATTDEYRDALSGEGEFGSLGYEWSDKPHRLVYDLCNEVDSLKSELSRLRSEKAPASSVEATGTMPCTTCGAPVKEHVVKCWPGYFDAIEAGLKPFDVRRDDRGYKQCDILVLKRYDPQYGYTEPHKELRRIISWVLPGGQFGIAPGHVVLGLVEAMPVDRASIIEECAKVADASAKRHGRDAEHEAQLGKFAAANHWNAVRDGCNLAAQDIRSLKLPSPPEPTP